MTTKKNPAKYTIEMDIKAFFAISSLFLVAGMIFFYLGVTVGKATRTPSNDLILSQDTDIIDEKEKEEIKNKLEIYKVRSSKKENVQSFSESQVEKKLREEYASILKNGGKNKQNSTTQSQVKQTQNKENENEVSTNKIAYTVQVLATGNKDKAMTYINSLKKKQFAAYVQKIKAPGTSSILYRVRVGRLASKEKAKKLYARLLDVMKGKGRPQIIQYKVSP